eukprot:6177559-Pleurochrysis_carterae.AAC.7
MFGEEAGGQRRRQKGSMRARGGRRSKHAGKGGSESEGNWRYGASAACRRDRMDAHSRPQHERASKQETRALLSTHTLLHKAAASGHAHARAPLPTARASPAARPSRRPRLPTFDTKASSKSAETRGGGAAPVKCEGTEHCWVRQSRGACHGGADAGAGWVG